MLTLTTAGLFAGAVMMLMISPGPNMAFVISHGAAYGPVGGIVAALGIALADIALTALTVTGITAAIIAWSPAFDLIRYAGAAYLLFLACKTLRVSGGSIRTASTQRSLWSVFVRAALNSLLNPKALVFFMVFLPQFVDARQGSIGLQLAMLGGMLIFIAFLFHASLGIAGGALHRRFSRGLTTPKLQSRGLALLFALLAARLVVTSRAS